MTDAGLPQLAELKSLKAINLRDCKVTAKGIEMLRKSLGKGTVIQSNAAKR